MRYIVEAWLLLMSSVICVVGCVRVRWWACQASPPAWWAWRWRALASLPLAAIVVYLLLGAPRLGTVWGPLTGLVAMGLTAENAIAARVGREDQGSSG
ncbi:MAG TPA: hypothetical protein VGM37_04575 [Armatimonadota bacterium]|jgi:hypothetical protein